jgi:putative protein-disulfide isomerase
MALRDIMTVSKIDKPVIWYIADPMCSWCWGFSPVVQRLQERYADKINFSLVLGGLRPYTQETINDDLREEILGHWRDVQRLTGQEFCFEGAMGPGFVYNTEPANRAVIVVSGLFAENTFDYLKAVQRAFYVGNRDVTQALVLWDILQSVVGDAASLTEEEFIHRFNSDDIKQKTKAHFIQSRNLGVRGFPTMILQDEQRYYLLNSGYQPFDELKREIDAYLEKSQ